MSLTNYIFSLPPSPGPGFRTFNSFCFVLGKAGEPAPRIGNDYNQWIPSDVSPKEGSTARWDEHLKYLFPDDTTRNHLLDWISWVYCNPNKHPNCAVMIQGEIQGTGKSLLQQILWRLLTGAPFATLSQRTLLAAHESWPLRTKLAVIEIRSGDKTLTSKLHDLITGASVHVDMKNAADFDILNVLAIMAEGNPLEVLAGIDNSDRRWLVASTDTDGNVLKPRGEADYYRPLYSHFNLGINDEHVDNPASLAAVAYVLKERNGGNYAGGRAPETRAKAVMIEAGASGIERWMIEQSESPPLCYLLVTVEEIIEAMPDDVKRSHRDPRQEVGARAAATVQRREFRTTGPHRWP